MGFGGFAVADVVMVILIGVSAVFGLVRGLIREVLSLVIWISALVLGIAFAKPLAGVLGLDLSTGLQTAIGFAIVFVAVLVGGALVQRFLGGLVASTGLTGTDRTLGLVFGTVRGAAVVLVALILLRPFAESRAWWSESVVAPPLLTFENEVIELFDLIMDAASGPAGVAPQEPSPTGTAFCPSPSRPTILPVFAALAVNTERLPGRHADETGTSIKTVPRAHWFVARAQPLTVRRDPRCVV